MNIVPVAVEIEGFLGFRDRTRLAFANADIYCISGENGAGKSALLNGLVFALYGEVYDTKTRLEQAIHHEAMSALARFVFRRGDRYFRVTRWLHRKEGGGFSSEGSAEVFDGITWIGIPGISKVGELDQWVQRTLGLSATAFLSVAVLMQDESGRLFKARRGEQGQILGGLLGMDFYRHLSVLVRSAAKEAERSHKAIDLEISKSQAVSDEDMEKAQGEATLARAEAIRVGMKLDSLRGAVAQAEERDRLDGQIRSSRDELTAAEVATSKVAETEARLRELRLVAEREPAIRAIVRIDNAIHHKSERLRIVEESLEKSIAEAEETDRLSDAARRELEEAGAARRGAQGSLADAQVQRNSVAGLLADAEQIDVQMLRLRELDEIVRGSSQATVVVSQYRAVVEPADRVRALANVVTRLEGDLADRNEAHRAVEAARAERDNADGVLTKARDSEKLAQEALSSLKNQVEEITRTGQEARAAVTSLETQLSGVLGDDGVAQCPTCLRGLDHADHEFLVLERASIEERLGQSRLLLSDTEVLYKGVSAQIRDTERNLGEHRGVVARSEGRLTEIDRSIEAGNRRFETARTRLHEAWKSAVEEALSLGLAPKNPSGPGALGELRESVDQRIALLERISPEYQEALAALDAAAAAKTESSLLNEEISRLRKTVGTRSSIEVRGELERLDDGLAAVSGSLKEFEQDEVRIERVIRGLGSRSRELATSIGQLRGEAGGLRSSLEEAVGTRSEQWGSLVRLGWDADQIPSESDLQTAVAARIDAAEVESVLGGLREQAGRISTLRDVLGELLTRRGRITAVEAVSDLKTGCRETESELRQTREISSELDQRLGALRVQKIRHDELIQRLGDEGLRAARLRALVEPLGQKGLQSKLMQSVLTGVLDCANDILSRISAGMLSLELHVEEDSDEYNILVRDLKSPEHPLTFRFCSGGQQFRVSVAMALGIGQYLAQQGGGQRFEGLIIDEGFGSQDTSGLQALLEELQRISANVGTVLVVSHREEVQRAISKGWTVVHDGSSSQVVPRGVTEALPAGLFADLVEVA